jgi:hypothetical protein
VMPEYHLIIYKVFPLHQYFLGIYNGRYWDRTSDLIRVKDPRYLYANRP